MAAASVLSPKRWLLLAVAVCTILYLANRGTRRIKPAHPDVAIAAEGSFQPGGWYAGEPFADASEVRAWGSWSGSDENVGTIAIGPFPAPRILRFGLSGYLNNPGNSLAVELVGTAAQLAILHGPVGEQWHAVDFELPAEWTGRPIRMVATDASQILGGWLAVSEPIRGGRGDGNNALLDSFATWSINGLLLGLMAFASTRWIVARGWLAAHWIPLGAGAIIAVFGYAAFWIYFANAFLGVIFSWTVMAAALITTLRPGGIFSRQSEPVDHPILAQPEARNEIRTVLNLLLAVGAFHLALLHLFPSSHDFYTLAANRYREGLPSDNLLPHALAERVFAGQPVKNFFGGWLSSDRPPLQTGWQLLTWPANKMLQLDRRTASGTSALWFQLLWVAAGYGLLRTLRVPRRRAAGWVAALALCGFFVQNTVFTWPKLSAAAFACGAFALLLLPPPNSAPRQTAAWAALFAALAWLSHGGVAFSFLALLPWIAWRARHGEWRHWLPAAAILAALMLPWLAYQKFYDPPGNRLLKWHLAGQTELDPRGTWETIRASYAKIGRREAWANKASNFHGQIFGNYAHLLDVSAETRAERRNHEFFHTGRALTWWPMLIVLGIVFSRRPLLAGGGDLAVLGGWLALTLIIWCLLMFGAYSAAIHQGSYAVMLGLFVFFSVALERCSRGWLAIIAVLQAITLTTTWAAANPVIHGPMTGLPIVIAATVFLGWFVVGAYGSRGPAAAVDENTTGASYLQETTEARALVRWTEPFLRWWANPRINLWLLVALGALIVLRKPHTLLTPQLWAEDGSIFLSDQDEQGLFGAFFRPYAGYLHVLPRLIAWLAAQLLDPAWWPAFYNGVACVIWLAVLARLFTARFDLPGKPWLALAFLLVPHSGEVLFNITNLQWLTAFVLIQQLIIAPPKTRGERIRDFAILLVVSLTGPFAIPFLPLFVWRWWHDRSRDNLMALTVVAAGALVQAWFVVRTGPRFDFQSLPLHLWPIFVVIARRLFVWPVLGHDLALSLSPIVIGGMGGACLLGLCAWVLRPHPRRGLRARILAALALLLLAGLYRTRPDTWAGDNLDFADRYFYGPRVLLAWLLIWEFHATPRWIANVIRLLCLVALLTHVGNYRIPPVTDYHWADNVEPIRRGQPARIPTLPEGWTLEYRGRPNSR